MGSDGGRRGRTSDRPDEGTFVSFDDVRTSVMAALATIGPPDGSPPIYLVRNLRARLGVSVCEDFRGDYGLCAGMESFASGLLAHLGAYGRDKPTVLWVDRGLLAQVADTAVEIVPGVFWVERLLVGDDWWTVGGMRRDGEPVRHTLHAIRGGMGRSTAAAILARHLARRGEDVLFVDLDVECPGQASIVLGDSAPPRFGVVDWFVEDLVGQGEHVVGDMVARPAWADELSGNVWAVPACGRDPGEYLSKLGRVYLSPARDPWTSRLNRLLGTLEAELGPAVVLLESARGFGDIAAATVTDIGAEVMLFAVDSPSHWTGYGILFDHWSAQGLVHRIDGRLSFVSALTPEGDTQRCLEGFGERVERLGEPLVIHWNRELATGVPLHQVDGGAIDRAYAPFLRGFDRRRLAGRGRGDGVDEHARAEVS